MNLSHFTNLYPVNKTLRFRLVPQGKTLENFEKNKIAIADERRGEEYSLVKRMMDDYHKSFIEKGLEGFTLPKEKLNEYYDLFSKGVRTAEDNEKMQQLAADLRKSISGRLTSQKEYKDLFSDEMVKKKLHSIAKTEAFLRV